jgi:ABC-type nitrate/sulfonate/bicarbonate transport system substrate-binding protein
MLKATVLVSALCFLALPAVAAPLKTTLAEHDVDVVEVQTRPSPAGTIVRDAVGGAILGGAIGGGVVIYNRYGTTNGTWDNWERTVLIGAGIGLGVGLIVGGVSAASQMDRSFVGPATEHRDVGFSPAIGQYGVRY